MRRLGVVASTDSAVKYCHLLAGEYARPGDRIDILSFEEAGRDLSREILANMGVAGPFRSTTVTRFLAREAWEYDVLFLFPESSALFAHFLEEFHRQAAQPGRTRRPLLVVGFIGIAMEHLLKGLANRQGADVICINTRRDYRAAVEISAKAGFDPAVLVRTGSPMAGGAKREGIRTRPDSGRRVVFATQPHWPGLKERRYILARLLQGCHRYPNDRFIVKLRMPEGKKSLHKEPYHYHRLFRQLGVSQPANLEFAYGSMQAVLDEADVLVTVSSTAAVESIARGIPTAILSDFGYDNAFGLHYFLGSGLKRTLEQVIDGDVSAAPKAEWLEENGFGREDNQAALATRLDALLEEQAATGTPLPLRPFYIGPERVAFHPALYQDVVEELVRKGFLQRQHVTGRGRWLLRHTLSRKIAGTVFPAHTLRGRWLRGAVHKWRAFREA